MNPSFVRVVLDYDCSVEGQPVQRIHIGDQFQLLKKTSSTWWQVRRDNTNLPFFLPVNCVEEISRPRVAGRRGGGASGSSSSLDRLECSFDQPPGSYSSGGSDEERGECFDNPIYALPNVTIASDGVVPRHHHVAEHGRKNRFSKVEYVNMKLALDCAPPIPAVNDVPVRTLEDSWEEFEDSLGRRYFFHPRTNLSSWKPPRKQLNLNEMDVDDADSDCMTDPSLNFKVAPLPAPPPAAETSQLRLHENSMPGRDYRETNTQMTTNLVETEAKVTAQLYSDLPPSPSPTQPVATAARHVNFMPRYNRCSSLMEDKLRCDEGNGALVLRDVESEKENTSHSTITITAAATTATADEKEKSASLPMPRRAPPSKGFLELRQCIADKVALPERIIKARSVQLLNEAHLQELDLLVKNGGMRNSKTLPTLVLGRMWKSDEDGLLRGFLNVTKFSEKGRRVKKKQWTPAYVMLKDSSLNVYRPPFEVDHAPEIFIDLLGATISWTTSKEKSQKKNVFEISTVDGSQVLMQDDNRATSHEWVNGIMNCISALGRIPHVSADLPSPVKVLPSPLDSEPSNFGGRPLSPGLSRILGRSRSTKVRPVNGVSIEVEPPAPVLTHQKKKSVDETESADPKVKKLRIFEMLKNFFSRRPTLESLKAKGIIRDGPVFGCNFLKLCEQEKNNVPTIVRRCIAAIEKKDMRTDGIYRVSGNLSQVQKLRFQIDQDKYSGMESEEDVNVLTGLLKLFFRELKEPMIPFQIYDGLMKANKMQDKSAKERKFRDLVGQLPGPNLDTIRFLFQHLYRVADLAEYNRMHLPNLAIVFGPTLMWPEVPSTNLAMDMLSQNHVVEYLLNFRGLFESHSTL